jgi:hypothetical protein
MKKSAASSTVISRKRIDGVARHRHRISVSLSDRVPTIDVFQSQYTTLVATIMASTFCPHDWIVIVRDWLISQRSAERLVRRQEVRRTACTARSSDNGPCKTGSSIAVSLGRIKRLI